MNFDDLILTDAFFQANTVKGYRFLDTAGQIMNDFEDRFQSLEMTVEGLLLSRPVDPMDHLREVKVTARQIWLHYGLETGWTELRQEVPKLVERIGSAMGVKGFSRQGFRTNLLCPVSDALALTEQLSRRAYNTGVVDWSSLGEPFVVELHTRVKVSHLKASVIVRPVRLTPPQPDRIVGEGELLVSAHQMKQLPQHGLLLDTDIYDDQRTPTLQVKPIVNNAVELLRDRFTPFLGRIIEEATQ